MKPGEAGEKPTKVFKSVCNSQFPYEVTVSFRLESERKGYVDLSDPRSYKMEGAHEGIFRNGDRISEEHGAALAAWARGEQPARPAPQGEKPRRGKDALFTDARAKAEEGSFAYHAWRADLPDRARTALDEIGDELAGIADAADQRDAGGYGLDDERGEAA